MLKAVKKLSILAGALMLTSVVVNATPVSAHEIFYNGSTGIVLKWNDVTSRTANLKINGDHLDGGYTSYYSSIKRAWPNASSRVSVQEASFSSSNIDLATASETAWDNRWGDFYSHFYLGVCDMTSTDGYELNSVENAMASSRKIDYAGILYTPYEDDYEGTTHMKKTMVHEIGHALGLGHPNTDYDYTDAASVMRQGYGDETHHTPQSHDKTDLNNKY